MRILFIIIGFALISCNGANRNAPSVNQTHKVNAQKEDTAIRINPYEELTTCAKFNRQKYGVIFERFRVFDKTFETNMFSNIDTICTIAYSSPDSSKKIMIEFWIINDSTTANKIYQYLLKVPNKTILYKPPQFWNWKLLNNVILFYYSFETNPNDEFFIKVFNQPVKQNNCCLE